MGALLHAYIVCACIERACACVTVCMACAAWQTHVLRAVKVSPRTIDILGTTLNMNIILAYVHNCT